MQATRFGFIRHSSGKIHLLLSLSDLRFAQITADFVRGDAMLQMLDAVSEHAVGLDLSYTDVTSLEGMDVQPRITALRLNGNQFTKTAFAELAISFPSLKLLEMRRCQIAKIDFNDIVFPPSMQWLDLRDTEMDAMGFCALMRNQIAHPNSDDLEIITEHGYIDDENAAFQCTHVTDVRLLRERKLCRK